MNDQTIIAPLAIRPGMRNTLGDLVLAEIRLAIVQLRLRPGHRLSEAEVARQLGISRQPVREAFIKLSEAGLVSIRPQRGTLVSLISLEQVENAHFVREAIEVAAARRAAQRADAAAIAGLNEIIARQSQLALEDRAAFMRLDEAFHEAIASCAGTSHAWRILDFAKAQLDRVRFLAIDEVTSTSEIIAEHRAIVDAIESHSEQRAEEAIRAHMAEILVSLPRLAKAHAELFGT